MTAEWSLYEPALGELALDWEAGYAVEGYDLGWPEVRDVTDLNADVDGEVDLTSFIGARLLTLDVRLTGSAAERRLAAGVLRQWMDPRRRPTVRWSGSPWGPVQASARGDRFANAIGSAMTASRCRLGWRIPAGVYEGQAVNAATLAPGSATSAGRTYDLVYDRVYPAAGPLGANLVTSGGTARAYPLLRLVGPVTAPVVSLSGGAGVWSLPALTVNAGDWVDIDTRYKTVLLNSLAASSVFSSLDFASLAWGWIEPGENTVTFNASGTGATSALVVRWRDAYL